MCWVTNQIGCGSSADLAVRKGHREPGRLWSFATPSPKGRRHPIQPRGARAREDRKPQLVQVTGSSRRAWRWLSRGARRRGQYLAGCEPVCGGITCSGRQDALPRLTRSPTAVLLCGPLGVEGMITHPVRCCSVPPNLCRELWTPPRAQSSADGCPPGPTCPTRRLCTAHAALSPPAALVFVLFVLWNCFADGPVRHRTTCRPEPAEGKAHSLPRCLTASLPRSLPHRRAASPPRCVVARPSVSVRPSVRSSVPASLSPSLLPLSPLRPSNPPLHPSVAYSLALLLPPFFSPPSFLPSSLPLSSLPPSLRPSLSLLRVALVGWRSHFEVGWSVRCSQWPRRYGTGRFGSLAPRGAPETRPRRAARSPPTPPAPTTPGTPRAIAP